MNEPIIEIKNISKKYQITQSKENYLTLRDTLSSFFKNPLKVIRESKENFWALKNINFSINTGEVIGIIGANGAGKSTLLKILSRITPPTEGEIKIKGSISSLLEVGTGFNPELTGRENIFLNGAILGMTRKEINKKFKNIVEFADIKKFLDTPVKRYSSGMYVRLAFSIAAHLEPDVLIIDEVLAVGDAEFQKKCLGKMEEITKEEKRTIIFVSHNMAAVKNLCSKCILLENGEINAIGETEDIIKKYLAKNEILVTTPLLERKDRGGNGKAKITNIKLFSQKGICSGEELNIIINYSTIDKDVKITNVGLGIWDTQDNHLISLETKFQLKKIDFTTNGKIVCKIFKLPLIQGEYFINPSIYSDGVLLDYVSHAAKLKVESGNFYASGKMPDPKWSIFLVNHEWFS